MYQDLLQQLMTMQRDSIDATARTIDDNTNRGTALIAVLSAIALVVGTVLRCLLTLGIVRPIQDAVS